MPNRIGLSKLNKIYYRKVKRQNFWWLNAESAIILRNSIPSTFSIYHCPNVCDRFVFQGSRTQLCTIFRHAKYQFSNMNYSHCHSMECALHSIFQMEGKKLASTMSKKRTRGANFVCSENESRSQRGCREKSQRE